METVPDGFLTMQEEGGSNVAVIFCEIFGLLHLLVAKEQSSMRQLSLFAVELF